jgi:hypothetical protein
MEKLVLTLKDNTKKDILLSMLKEFSFVKIEEIESTKNDTPDKKDFRKLYGLWKSKRISLAKIRKTAWDSTSK